MMQMRAFFTGYIRQELPIILETSDNELTAKNVIFCTE
jgi:hypothetical protein